MIDLISLMRNPISLHYHNPGWLEKRNLWMAWYGQVKAIHILHVVSLLKTHEMFYFSNDEMIRMRTC
jgi:hypothetical protein